MKKHKYQHLLDEAQASFDGLPGYVKAQAGPVLKPVIGLLRVLLGEVVEREERRVRAIAHLDKTGNGLREKTALGIYLTGGNENASDTKSS